MGLRRYCSLGLIALIAGILLRSEGSAAALFAGTAVLATGIAVANVLLPMLIKQHYPSVFRRSPRPTRRSWAPWPRWRRVFRCRSRDRLPGGWQSSLASWALPWSLPRSSGCLTCARRRRGRQRSRMPCLPHPPWRTRLAWQVTSFMGLQSTLFYIAISWYPAILRDNGFSPTSAGWLLTLFQVAALLAAVCLYRC